MKKEIVMKLGYWDIKTDRKRLLSGKSSVKKVFTEIETIEPRMSLSDFQWLIKIIKINGFQSIYNKLISKSIPQWLHENNIYLSMNEIIQAAHVRQKFHKNSKNLKRNSLMTKYKRMLKHKTKEKVLQKVIQDRDNKEFSSRYFYNIRTMINDYLV